MTDERCIVSEWLEERVWRWCTRDSRSGMWLAYEPMKMRRGRSAHRLAGIGRTLAQLAESLRSDDGERDLPHDDEDAWGPWNRKNEEQTLEDLVSGATTMQKLMLKARRAEQP